jgi:hypothetical protein
MLLLAAAVAVHGGVLLAVYVRSGHMDKYAFASLDCHEFYSIARNLAQHASFSQSESPPLTPDTWRTPGYPLFLAPFVFTLGDSPVPLILIQQALSILNVPLLFLIARRWMSDRRAMIVAALFLVEPYHLYYSLWLMSTTLFVGVLLLTWHAWCLTVETLRWRRAALLGLFCGFLVLVRPLASLSPLALLAGLTVLALRTHRKHTGAGAKTHAWMPVPVFAALCVVVVGSWMTRNHVVAGHFALSHQGGVVLAYFKATEVELWRRGRAADRYIETTPDPEKADRAHTIWDQIDARLQARFAHFPDEQRADLRWQNLAQGNRTTVDPFAVSRALSKIGWSYLMASPFETATCYLVRSGSVLTFPLNLALRPPVGVEPERLTWAVEGSVYLLLCIAAVIRILRGGLPLAQFFFPLACTVALLLATTPQLDPRFRVPMVPLLLLTALLPRSTR